MIKDVEVLTYKIMDWIGLIYKSQTCDRFGIDDV
jgi:hypothetical protein